MKLPLVSLIFSCLAATALSAAEPIKVGEVASLTGKEAAFGQSSHRGTLIAIEELNAAGGLLGKKINFIFC